MGRQGDRRWDREEKPSQVLGTVGFRGLCHREEGGGLGDEDRGRLDPALGRAQGPG